MLSILIPTYNYACFELVDDLHRQALSLGIDYEIIVADDASPREDIKHTNRQINTLPHCRFVELEENKGRSRIRNYLGEAAVYPYLIFMDCDAKVATPTYIQDYLSAKHRAEVIVGGILNPPQLPSPTVSLRYYYEKSAAIGRSLEERNAHPQGQFTTFNVFIRKETFLSIRFDDSFTRYGHEDTVFGMELKRRNIPVLHINNPLYHMGLEENAVYLQKVHTSIENLLVHLDKLEDDSQLYLFYKRLESKHLLPLVYTLYKISKKLLIKNLLGPRPGMKLFAFYKLGYLCEMKKKGSSDTR